MYSAQGHGSGHLACKLLSTTAGLVKTEIRDGKEVILG